MEEAINAHIAYLKFQGDIGGKPVDERYGVNTAFRRGIEIEIKIIQDTPRNIKVIDRLLERKKLVNSQAERIEDGERLFWEIGALQWLRMIVNSGPEEWIAWSLLNRA